MNPEVIKAVIFHFVIGSGLIWAGFRLYKRSRIITDTPRSKSASAPQGFVELHGFAWPLEAPYPTINGKYAVYYSLELQRSESEGSGKNRRSVWRTKATTGTNGPFFLVDPTGLTLIDDKGIIREIENATTTTWKSLSEGQKNTVLELFAGKTPSDFPPSSSFFGLFSSTYRIAEHAIFMGSPVHASGHFRLANDSEAQPTRVHGLTKFIAHTMDESARTERNIDSKIDRDRNGKVSAREAIDGYSSLAKHAWDSAGDISEEREFMIHGSLESSLDHGLHVSDKREEHLVRALRIKYRIALAIGSVFVASGLTILVTEPKKSSERKSEFIAQTDDRIKQAQSTQSHHAKAQESHAQSKIEQPPAAAQAQVAPQQEASTKSATPPIAEFHKEECRTNSRACWVQFTNALQPFGLNDVPEDMKLAVVKLQLHDLHYTCAGGVAEACEVLLSVPAKIFGLTAAHESAYARAGCKAGNAKLCEWRAPASK